MNQHDPRLPAELELKLEDLKNALRAHGKIVLAFSGGIDSIFLMAVAKAAAVECLAVTVQSEFFTPIEAKRAKDTARKMGVAHLCLNMDMLTKPEVARNDARRCYYCKQYALTMIKGVAIEQGINTWVHGINVDDLGDYRPGIEAANALDFQAPLVAAGFSKSEIRRCAKAMGLSAWNLPSQSCLATRIPVGTAINHGTLKKIAQAEAFLHDMGFVQVRVRCHGALARIETGAEEVTRLIEAGTRNAVYRSLKSLGFAFVALDLGGYETGKMNAVNTDVNDNEGQDRVNKKRPLAQCTPGEQYL